MCLEGEAYKPGYDNYSNINIIYLFLFVGLVVKTLESLTDMEKLEKKLWNANVSHNLLFI